MFRATFVHISTLAVMLASLAGSGALGGDLELIESRKIWDAAAHNAFTDLARYQGKWVCAFREASAHAGGVKGSQIRVIVSDDAQQWESAATIDDQKRGDIRDAKLALMPDGRLMLLTATQLFDKSGPSHQSHAWFTKDLKNWDGPHDVGDPGIWTWGIVFHKGIGYSIGYRAKDPKYVRLYSTKDGEHFDTLVENLAVENVYPNESVIVFDRDSDRAYCLLRCQGPAQLGVATAPYDNWQWKVADRPVGGPEMIQLADGRLLGGGRFYDDKVRTSLFWVDPETAELSEALKLPSGGDTSYPGFVIQGDTLYVSYYSSHEGKSSIYLAKVKLNGSAASGSK